jgi:hypothetical protein
MPEATTSHFVVNSSWNKRNAQLPIKLHARWKYINGFEEETQSVKTWVVPRSKHYTCSK